jgi:archaellum biogenesis ATPase FlaH
MKYIEIAKGTPFNRGIIIPTNRLSNHLGEEPVYRSVYLYDETAFEYVKENGSLKNFFGVRYIDKIPVDIDKQDRSDDRTLDILRGIILELEDADIGCGSFQSYFSGSGYHLILSGDLFNFQPGNDLPFIVKQTMKKLMPDIDSSIYMRTGIYRLQHTPNQKTDLYKIPLTRNEVMNKNPEEIFELAKTPRLDFKYHILEGNSEFEDKIVKEVPDVQVFNKISEPTKIIPCVQSMLNQGAREGSRHITAMRIISHFKRHGIPSHYAKVCMLHWNNKSMPEQQVMEMVENVYNRNYKYGCQDSVMLQHCKTQCVHFQRKDYLVDIKSASTMQEELSERLTTDFSGKTIDLSRALGLDVESTIYPGELVTIFGPTGSNKTTFAQNLALGVDFVNNRIVKDWQIPTLFLSLELSSWYMHRRHLQVVSGKTKEQVNDNYKRLYDTHKDELEHVMVQTVSPTLDKIYEKVRELQPQLVIVDYIDLVDTPVSYRGEYEKIKYISHGLSNMAVNNDLIVIQISQVSREYSRNEVLDLYAGKGSGAIENASRKVIGLNGQPKSSIRQVRLFKNTDGELFDTTVEWQPSFRLRRTDAFND